MAVELVDLKHENIYGESPIKLNLGHSRQRAIYWRQIGEDWVQTGLLPADPLSIALYFSKGFRAKPPPEVVDEVVDEVKSFSCSICGFEAKSELGLLSHQRKHK